ncbi:MAG: S41 family peptidase [Anaerolineae bacterium]|nr:S41 family peptidase [Anaerolineae bacterium]
MNSSSTFPGRFLPTAILIGFVFALGVFVGSQHEITFAQGSGAPTEEAREAFQAFWQAYNLIHSDYIDRDQVDDATLVNGAIDGMMNALGDEFSGYMDPDTFEMMNDDLDGEITGIGVVIRTNEDEQIEVVSVLEGTPAQAAGILPGDIFVAVDGQDMTGVSQLELALVVRGQVGTTVDITMLRDDQLVEFEIERQLIQIQNVESERLDGDIGYVRLNEFSPDARAEMDAALDDLQPDTLEGLIIDFRGNLGGLLNSAIDVGSLLVNEGTLVTEDFGDQQDALTAEGNALSLDIPIVLLVDESSASASELVAGAWQDYGVVTVIGETTFGKGTVQTWHSLINGGGARITIARWLTPDGQWIHRQGITPDIVVEWSPMTAEEFADDIQLDAALDYLHSETVALPQN